MSKFRFKKFKHPIDFLKNWYQQYQNQELEWSEIDDLIHFVETLRPSKVKSDTTVDIKPLVAFLQTNPELSKAWSAYLSALFSDKKCSMFIADAGIMQDTGFMSELMNRISSKFIPTQPLKDHLEYILTQVFYKENDCLWIANIPEEQLVELLKVLEVPSLYDSVKLASPMVELLQGINLINQRMSGRAMESDVLKMVPEYHDKENPFQSYEREFNAIAEKIYKTDFHFVRSTDIGYRQLMVMHQQCKDFVKQAFRNSAKFGISMRVNQNLLKIRQQLKRLEKLLPLLCLDDMSNRRLQTVHFGKHLLDFNSIKYNVRHFIAESTQVISYEVTQHAAKTGEHYITESRSQYLKMFRGALGGGFIVGFLCIIKVLLAKVDTSQFGHAFWYSMNYSVGFILIYLCGFTLATKQPAMTAPALAKALEEGRQYAQDSNELSLERYRAFAVLFSRLFRSQFIAFVGNVVMAFPVALGGIWIIDKVYNYNIASTKWPVLISDLSPIHSNAILHASIAGVFLFLSGIISGSITNKNKHHNLYYRIEEHPGLKRFLGKNRAKKLAGIYEKYSSGVISNFWFGVMMGTTGTIGLFLGLDLDIRHITFASGNLALGWYGSGFQISNSMWFWSIFGIGVIGWFNFIVSFILSVTLALRSRSIPLSELGSVGRSVWMYFKERPTSFFIPVGLMKTADDSDKQNQA